jgi:Kef-type K+ transport system membrane component KefB
MRRYLSHVDMEINIQSASQQNARSNPVCFLVSKVTIFLFSLHALIALCMAYSYKFMNDEENEILISRVLSKINVFADV